MDRRWRIHLRKVAFQLLVVNFVLCPVLSITVRAPAEIAAVKGDVVTLSCSFTSTSRTTSRMSVDWAFRPQSGGPSQIFFYFYSKAYPPLDVPFKGRVKWLGSPSRGDASIQLLNVTLADNGTYTCFVRNPPDAHGPPAQTLLTVTPKKMTIVFTDVAVLLLFVLLPSAAIVLFLLGRILCPCCLPKEKSHGVGYRSPIEVPAGEEYSHKQPVPKPKSMTCCELYLLDSDEDDYYPRHHEKPQAESQC